MTLTKIGAMKLLLATSLYVPISADAVSLTNGNFETGDFTGWSLDTDGFGGLAPDIQVNNSGGSQKARIEADYWSTPGDYLRAPLDGVFCEQALSSTGSDSFSKL